MLAFAAIRARHLRSDRGELRQAPLEADTAESDRRQANDWVWREIRKAIVSLEFAPGPRWEAALSACDGISKTPIREAFFRLEKEGLVEINKYRGARVRGYSVRDVREIYDLRELLEGFCARQAAMRISPEDEEALRTNVSRSRRLLADDDIDGVADAFDEFDALLYRQSEDHRISSLIDDLAAHLDRLGRMTVTITGRIESSIDQHEAIVLAISRRDPDAAEQACRAHIRSVASDIMGSIELDWQSDLTSR